MAMVETGSVLAVDRKRQTATVDIDGRESEISVDLLDKVAIGDQVLVYLGVALNRVDAAKAAATLERMAAEAMPAPDAVIAA